MAQPLRPSLSFLTALALGATSAVEAQTPVPSNGSPLAIGVVAGIVSDSDGVGIAGANVSLLGVSGQAYSDAEGVFRMQGVIPGDQRLLARRIGFRPETLAVSIPADRGLEVSIRLRAAALQIAPVVIAARGRYSGPLRGFLERRDRGNGHFFTAEDI